MSSSSLISLLHICSPVFPTGVFSHSYGCETLLEDGYADTPEGFTEYLRGVLLSGSGRTDAALLALAYSHPEMAAYYDRLATAMKPTSELRSASRRTGRAFLKAYLKMYPEHSPEFAELTESNYSVMFAAASRLLEIPLRDALEGFLTSTLLSAVSCGIKLIPLSQLTGQQIVRDCSGAVEECTEYALNADESSVTGFSPMSDISSMRHEGQYSRMYIS